MFVLSGKGEFDELLWERDVGSYSVSNPSLLKELGFNSEDGCYKHLAFDVTKRSSPVHEAAKN
jgi:hypothetical protein